MLGLKYKKTQSGDFEHGIAIYILDETGTIQYVQTKLGQDGEGAVSTLMKLVH